jgi:hypothetical protein
MYAVEIGSGVKIYMPTFIKLGLGIQKGNRRDSQTHREHGDSISLLYRSMLKIEYIFKTQ